MNFASPDYDSVSVEFLPSRGQLAAVCGLASIFWMERSPPSSPTVIAAVEAVSIEMSLRIY